MIQEETTNTVKCPSCGAPIPEAALLCPGCGKPNISSAFASPDTSFFALATDVPPAEVLPEMPSTGTASASEQPVASAPSYAAPPTTAERSAPSLAAPTPGGAHIVMVQDVIANRLRSKLEKLDRQWAAFAPRYYVERTDGSPIPPSVKDPFQRLIRFGAVFLAGLFILATGLGFGVTLGWAFMAVGAYGFVLALGKYSRAHSYQQEYRRYLAERKEILDRLRRLEGRNSVSPEPR